ncbi:MAG: TetR/AcrR family transcriptional regulator [Anaerolineaceae bacterium]|nr:TetR/AcrR family transcriptional regulator [Anaerolineaceae bacterium]
MSPKPDVSEERINQILEAAINVFSRLGFNKARMDDIAEETNLSKGTLYLYFKSKDDLTTAIISKLFDSEFEKMIHSTYEGGSVSEHLMELTEDLIKNTQSLILLRPIVYEVYAASFRNKKIREVMKNYYGRYLDHVTPIIKQGIDQGEFQDNDPETAAIATAAIIEGTILLWIFDPDRVDLSRHIRQNIQIFLKGLSK